MQEFENYYAADDYFELMIRNAWHISGGVGAAANSSNRRVLVTQADGRQTVEEIKNDIGMRADDKAAMMKNLKLQGIIAAKLESAYGDNPNKNTEIRDDLSVPSIHSSGVNSNTATRRNSKDTIGTSKPSVTPTIVQANSNNRKPSRS